MKKLMFLLLSMVALTTSAQDEVQASAMKFGYLSYETVFQSMPEYATMKASMAQLREKYEAEQKRVEDDFNKKYEEFLDGQSGYPATILQKRQAELQEMLDKNIAFKKDVQRLLEQAEAEAKAPLATRLADALARIGQERGFAFILDTDKNAAPWINTALGENITEAVQQMLQ